MKFYLGVTDNEWYNFLAKRSNEDINFWQPGGNVAFRVLQEGEPFLFKLKYPQNAIAGIGFFSTHAFLPIDLAWDIFQERNGVESLSRLKQKIENYRNGKNSLAQHPNIGCIVLTDPIFFDRSDWIPVPSGWKNSIVQGKSYSTTESEGALLWQQVEARLARTGFFQRQEDNKDRMLLEEPRARYGTSYLQKVRIGQGAFRVQLTQAYQKRCSISGEKTLPVLDAAHIKPYAESGPHRLSNGLLLRADLHRLFDKGYITITKDYKVEISKKIREEFENGKEYYRYHGNDLLLLPEKLAHRPDPSYIDWHNTKLFNG